MSGTLAGVRGCVFDAYGTLFDFASAVARERGRLGERADELNALWRSKQLEYTWLRSLMGRHTDFWHVTGEALDWCLDHVGIDDRAVRDALLDAYLTLDAYPEVPEVLRRLRAAGMPRLILSNGEPEMLDKACRSAGIAELLDGVLTVESVGVFKPHRRVYQLAADRLGALPGEIGFFSSNGWDVAGAAAFGLRAVWVNRTGAPAERLPAAPEAVLDDLHGVPALLGA